MDMRYHTTDPAGLDPEAFEHATLAELHMPNEIVMRHRSPHFRHIFSDEGYSAGYYGYMWADVLTADAAEAFAEAPGGFYDKDLAKRLVDTLFAVMPSTRPTRTASFAVATLGSSRSCATVASRWLNDEMMSVCGARNFTWRARLQLAPRSVREQEPDVCVAAELKFRPTDEPGRAVAGTCTTDC